ncbi:hypothetical protein [Amycolatopsis sp. NPDC051071]|uniref:hypothetical protein n=1 Tax=Amycolatopsis sp. NPDC051071 TaxID=3154637 RepID=UPI00342E2728
MEINPRLPAWVRGASVCGANLPLALLSGTTPSGLRRLSSGFTRIIEEIPVHRSLGIVPFPWTADESSAAATKHPSGMPTVGKRRLLSRTSAAASPEHDRAEAAQDPIMDLPAEIKSSDTPCQLLLPRRFTDRVLKVRQALAPLRDVTLAHSIKTCPEPSLLKAAADLGMVAEAITQDELATAIEHGFSARNAMLNGPAKWWPERQSVTCDAFFADSVRELELVDEMLDNGFELDIRVVAFGSLPAGSRAASGCPPVTSHTARGGEASQEAHRTT